MSNIRDFLEQVRNETVSLLSDEEKKCYRQWCRDDAGSDLISFMPDTTAHEECSQIQEIHSLLFDLKEIEEMAEIGKAYKLLSKVAIGPLVTATYSSIV